MYSTGSEPLSSHLRHLLPLSPPLLWLLLAVRSASTTALLPLLLLPRLLLLSHLLRPLHQQFLTLRLRLSHLLHPLLLLVLRLLAVHSASTTALPPLDLLLPQPPPQLLQSWPQPRPLMPPHRL